MFDLYKQNILNQTEKEKTNHIMVISMLQIRNHKYYNHNSIIKFIDFELIYYIINLNIVSSFSEFVQMFLSMYCWFKSIILLFF